MARWTKAYAFLAAQTKPTEIDCLWVVTTGGNYQTPHVVGFYSFSDREAWTSHRGLHQELPAGTEYEMCQATVPTSVAYRPAAINAFLAHHGLPATPDNSGGTSIFVNYAGVSPQDPTRVYRDEPGLFGLTIAFSAIEPSPFTGVTHLTPPTDEATATRYLRYAQPLLAWYGYTG